ncbi:MAG: hypothetical protein EBE86_003815 [Hormoscilla sp. GUM202]|nr:hypothetical protein [Hormoscilla sp. GUM202]
MAEGIFIFRPAVRELGQKMKTLMAADAQRNELLRELERKNIAIDLAPIEAQSATRIKSDPRYLAPAW